MPRGLVLSGAHLGSSIVNAATQREVQRIDTVQSDGARPRIETGPLSLRDFIRQAWHAIEPRPLRENWHIDCLADHLEAASQGDPEMRRLAISIPPRFLKSSLVAVLWPAWDWTRWPWRRWLFNSYGLDLSLRDAKRARRLIEHPWYQDRWAPRFNFITGDHAAGEYHNSATGYRISTSVSGGNTGKGGDISVADDPHNVKEAESDTMRNAVIDWWDTVMPNRYVDLETFVRVVVQQRTHQDDLVGHLYQDGGYHFLNLAAEHLSPVYAEGYTPTGNDSVDAPHRDSHVPQPHDVCPVYADPRTEPGQPLDAGIHDLLVAEYRDDEFVWASQYMQRPIPRAGANFDTNAIQSLPHWFDQPYRDSTGREASPRERLDLFAYIDLAWSKRATADWSAFVAGGMDRVGDIYALHFFRERLAREDHVGAFAEVLKVVRPKVLGVEIGAFRQRLTMDFVRLLDEAIVGAGLSIAVVPVTVDTAKEVRWQVPIFRAKLGKVYADKTHPRWSEFAAEIQRAGGSGHDDYADAWAGLTELLVEKAPVPIREPGSYQTQDHDRETDEDFADEAFGQRASEINRRAS